MDLGIVFTTTLGFSFQYGAREQRLLLLLCLYKYEKNTERIYDSQTFTVFSLATNYTRKHKCQS